VKKIALGFLLFLGACTPESVYQAASNSPTAAGVTGPYVDAISPSSGIAGQSVVITGSGISGGTVMFGSVEASTGLSYSSDGTTITVEAPSGSGTVSVTVMVDGSAVTDDSVSGLSFTYTTSSSSVTLSSISPASGSLTATTAVTIFGSGFVSGDVVSFNGVQCTNLVVYSSTEMTCTAPASATAGTASVEIMSSADSLLGSSDSLFSYPTASISTPSISSLSSSSGLVSGGYLIALYGSQFASGASIYFGSNPVSSPAFIGPGQYNVYVPAASAAGIVTVKLRNVDGGMATTTFLYNALVPSVSAVSPNVGLNTGGTWVTITGSNFVSNAAVYFNGFPATSVTVQSASSIVCQAPAGAPGGATIVVLNPSGAQSPGAYIFVYEVSVPAGFFSAPNGGFWSNGTGGYCGLEDFAEWLAAGGPPGGGNDVTNYNPIPAVMAYGGICPFPAGFFWIGGAGFYSNGQGWYCIFNTWKGWLDAGGPKKGAAAVPNYDFIPNTMTGGAVCGN
jgi:hypothetical protein